MSKIKIIDLLNMISKGEEVPKKIKYKGHIYQYQFKDIKEANIINYYYSEETHHHLIDGDWHDIRLNDEVEIIEEKKIPEKLETYKALIQNIYLDDLCYKHIPIYKDRLSANEQVIVDKLNEVLDYLKIKGE